MDMLFYGTYIVWMIKSFKTNLSAILRKIAWCMQRKTYCPDNFGKTFVSPFLSLTHAHILICTDINNHESKIASHMWERTSNLQRISSSIIFLNLVPLNWSDYYYHCCRSVDRIKLWCCHYNDIQDISSSIICF